MKPPGTREANIRPLGPSTVEKDEGLDDQISKTKLVNTITQFHLMGFFEKFLNYKCIFTKGCKTDIT